MSFQELAEKAGEPPFSMMAVAEFPQKDFVNLHTYTTFSILHSLIEPEEAFIRAKELGMSALGITDSATIAAAWDSLKYSRDSGIKLIIGCEFNFVEDLTKQSRARHLILLAKNHQGYKNLLKIHKLANDNHIIAYKKVFPRINWEILETYSEGLICLTGGGQGILAQPINNKNPDGAFETAKRLKSIFGDSLGLEVQPNNLKRNLTNYNDYEDQALVNRTLIRFGKELDIRVVATSPAHFLNKEQFNSHDVMEAVKAGQPIKSGARLKYTEDFYLKSREEIVKFFSRHYANQAEEFCDNSLYFANMCEQPDWIDPKFTNPSGKELPEFPVNKQSDYQEFKIWLAEQTESWANREDFAYLRRLVYTEFKNGKIPTGREDQYWARLQKELEVFELKDLSSYMLIVGDYVNWARNENIPVGTGRGSCSASLVAYLMRIHDADPIKYNLLFERFYNREKTGLSDIDMDISQAGKPRLERYIINKYGEDYCAQVSNFSTLTAKPYARAISRAFLFGGDQKSAVAVGNAIAAAIPNEIHSVTEALAKAPLFAEFAENERYHQLKDYAKDLGGKTYNLSTHAGAMIIGKRPLAEIVPLRRTKDGDLAVEYEKDRAEANGLAKMDLLGLSTLDIIADVFKLIKENSKIPPSIPWNYDENDTATYDLITRGDTFGVFQFGTSGGTIDLCKKLKPKNIEDLAIINALTRPGFPKEVRDDFIKCKEGSKQVKLISPLLENAFKATFGYALFEESLLQLAHDVAGWDLDQADRLRKFVKNKGKDPKKIEQLKNDFINSSIKNGVEKTVAVKIWGLVNNLQGYAFNKSHAVTYSMLGYQTAYLKTHFPLEFLIANLNFESNSNSLDAEDNILKLKEELRRLGINILPPDINHSELHYKITDDKNVITGFNSLKFMGKDAVPEIVDKRPFTSFEEFLTKVDGRKVKAPAIQAMAAAGALDHFGIPRKIMFLYSHDYKKKLATWLKKEQKVKESFNYPFPEIPDWTIPELAALEMKYIGEMLGTDMKKIYPGFFANRSANFKSLTERYPQIEGEKNIELDPTDGCIQGLVKSFFEFKVKKQESKIFGEKMAKMEIMDLNQNSMMVTLFPQGYRQFKERVKSLVGSKFILEPGCPIILAGTLNWHEGVLGVVFKDLMKIGTAPALPKDLKPQKVSMKISGKNKKAAQADDILEEIEDELIEEGMLDLVDLESPEDVWFPE